MQYNGFYIGTVVDNNDSTDEKNGYLGRIKVSVPSVTGSISKDALPWAEPCFPYASNDRGFFFIPEVGAKVTVYFIEGSPNKPVWIGCIYREVDKVRLPISAVKNYPNRKVLKTDTGQMLFDDTDSYIELKHKNGSVFWVDKDGNIGFQNDKNHYLSINNDDNSIQINHATGSFIKINEASVGIVHKSGSNIIMDSSGNISIHSAKDLILESDGKMTLHSASNLNLLSDKDIYETSNDGNIYLNTKSGDYAKGNIDAVKSTKPESPKTEVVQSTTPTNETASTDTNNQTTNATGDTGATGTTGTASEATATEQTTSTGASAAASTATQATQTVATAASSTSITDMSDEAINDYIKNDPLYKSWQDTKERLDKIIDNKYSTDGMDDIEEMDEQGWYSESDNGTKTVSDYTDTEEIEEEKKEEKEDKDYPWK